MADFVYLCKCDDCYFNGYIVANFEFSQGTCPHCGSLNFRYSDIPSLNFFNDIRDVISDEIDDLVSKALEGYEDDSPDDEF